MKALEGTGRLVRHLLRRERFIASTWIALVVLMVVGTLHQYARVFPTEQARESFAEFIHQNRLLLAFSGQLSAPSLAGLAAWKISDTLYTLLPLLTVLTVVRHTRAEEESGRYELLAACGIGRHASLTATLLVACGANVLAGLLSALGWMHAGCDPYGSLLFGCALAAPGCVFAMVAAVMAQLSASARTAHGASFVWLGVGYLLRFMADGTGQTWLKWLSPQGWSHQLRPFSENRGWVLALPLTAMLVLGGTAYVLAERRDLGTGVLPARPGPAEAPGLTGPVALAWRLQRGMLWGWVVGFAALGALMGGVAHGVWDAGSRSPWWHELYRRYSGSLETPFVDVFLWILVLSLGYSATLHPILATLRLTSEEESGRAELVLATPVSRWRWMASHLVFVGLGPVAVMFATGLAAGLAHGVNTGAVGVQVPRLIGAALVQVPAIWVVGAVSVFAQGALPRRATAISWSVFIFINVFGEVLGPVLHLDYDVADQAIPFHHLPKVLSGGPLAWTPLLVLTGLAVLLGALGLWTFRRRDLG